MGSISTCFIFTYSKLKPYKTLSFSPCSLQTSVIRYKIQSNSYKTATRLSVSAAYAFPCLCIRNVILQIYTGSFFTIPLVRWFIVSKRNNEIETRNLAREIRAQALQSPDPSLRRKISSARELSQRISIGQDRIVYSTENDMFEKEYEKNEWDLRFREIEKSE